MRDDTKNGCVADYFSEAFCKIHSSGGGEEFMFAKNHGSHVFPPKSGSRARLLDKKNKFVSTFFQLREQEKFLEKIFASSGRKLQPRLA